MIVAAWFSIVACVMLVGMGLVVLTFRHWILERRKQKLVPDVKNEAALPEQTHP